MNSFLVRNSTLEILALNVTTSHWLAFQWKKRVSTEGSPTEVLEIINLWYLIWLKDEKRESINIEHKSIIYVEVH